MPAHSQLPGSLNLLVKRGDDFSTAVDFDISLVGYSVSASMHSLVTSNEVAVVGTAISSPNLGQVTVSLPGEQTSSLSPGSYGWSMKWVTPTGSDRTVLSGILEVIR